MENNFSKEDLKVIAKALTTAERSLNEEIFNVRHAIEYCLKYNGAGTVDILTKNLAELEQELKDLQKVTDKVYQVGAKI